MSFTARSAKSALRFLLRANLPVIMYSLPGIGKSSIVNQLADEMKMDFRDVRLSQMDPTDIKGLPSISKDGSQCVWLPPDFLPPTNTKKPGILLLDELTAAPPLVQVAAYQLILDRKVGNYELPKNWRIIAAGNRAGDRAVAAQLSSALNNRLVHIDIEPNAEVFCDYAAEVGMSPMIIAYLKFKPTAIHTFDSKSNPRAFASPRSWEMANALLHACNHQMSSELHALLQGTIGSAADEFYGFMRTYTELPTVDEVLSKPREARVPSQPDALYAITTALALAAKERGAAKYGAIMDYIDRIAGREFQVLFMKQVLNYTPALAGHAATAKWIAKNGSILTGN